MGKREIVAWIVLSRDGDVGRFTPSPIGNGAQFQFPIFLTRKEATQFAGAQSWATKVARCTITMTAPPTPTPEG